MTVNKPRYTDPIAALISQAERLYENDEPRAGQHFIILIALHGLDFAQRGFGPRAFDAHHKPAMEATT